MPHFRWIGIQTIREIRVAELQVLAGTSRVALCAQRVLHLLDFQLEGVEGAKDFLHAVVVVLVVGIHGRVVHHLAGVDVPTSPALHGGLDGEWVDYIARRALLWEMEGGETKWQSEIRYVSVRKTKEIMTLRMRYKMMIEYNPKVWCIDLQEGQEVQVYRSLPLVRFDPGQHKSKQCLIFNDT